MNMRLAKDCKHGQLQSTCEICAEIEALVQQRDSAVKAAKYAEHIDATPENQRETMLYDVLKERDGLRLMEQGLEKTVEQLVHERDAYKVERVHWQEAAMYRAAEVKTLRDALTSFTKSDYIKRQHPKRYAAARAALGETK